MGIQYDAPIVFGWCVSYDKLRALTPAKNARSDDDFDDRVQKALPSGLTLVRVNGGYQDICDEDYIFYLTLREDCYGMTPAEIADVPSETVEAVMEFLKEELSILSEPTIMAYPNRS